MKIKIIVALFCIVFIFFIVISYFYWKTTKENSSVGLHGNTTSSTPVGNFGKYVSVVQDARSDILVYENSEYPTVVAMGDIAEFQFTKDKETGEPKLFVKLLTEGEILPVRIDTFSVTGKALPGFIIKEINQDQEATITMILEERKGKSMQIVNSYVSLTSINTPQQKELCINNAGTDFDTTKWCNFDPAKKSFSQQELLDQLLKNLKPGDKNANIDIPFLEYLSLDGNIMVGLQINYR